MIIRSNIICKAQEEKSKLLPFFLMLLSQQLIITNMSLMFKPVLHLNGHLKPYASKALTISSMICFTHSKTFLAIQLQQLVITVLDNMKWQLLMSHRLFPRTLQIPFNTATQCFLVECFRLKCGSTHLSISLMSTLHSYSTCSPSLLN